MSVLKTRFAFIATMIPLFEEYYSFYKAQGYHPDLLLFARLNKDMFTHFINPMGIVNSFNSRTFSKLNGIYVDHMAQYPQDNDATISSANITMYLLYCKISGCIGAVAADSFSAMLRAKRENPSIRDILKNPSFAPTISNLGNLAIMRESILLVLESSKTFDIFCARLKVLRQYINRHSHEWIKSIDADINAIAESFDN